MTSRLAFGSGTQRVIQEELLIESDRRLAVSAGATKVGQYINPDGQTNGFVGGNIIRFRFPSDGIVDFRESCITFGATTTILGAIHPLLPKDITGLLSRVVVKLNGQPVVDEIGFNLFEIMTSNKNPAGWESTVGKLTKGYSDVALTREANAANVNKRYAIQFRRGLFHDKIIPLKFCPEFQVEITLAQPSDCLFRNAAIGTLVYTVNDVKFHFDTLNLDASFDQFVLSKINGGGLPIIFRTITNYQYPSFVGTNLQFQLPIKVSAAQQVYMVMRNQAAISDDTVDTKLTTYNNNNFGNHRLKINNEYLPNDAIRSTIEAWEALSDAWGISQDDECRGATNYETTSFILAQQLDPHRETDLSTGVNLANGSSSVIVEINLNAAPVAAQAVDVFLLHENMVLIQPSRTSTFFT